MEQNTKTVKEVPVDATKEQIRCLLANMYDLQKLRISAGNRIVQSFYLSMGIDNKTKLSENEEESLKAIEAIKKEYKSITEGAVDKNCTTNKMIKELQKNDKLKFIRNDTDYRLVTSYIKLQESEDEAYKVLNKYVIQHPLWVAFFNDIKGCGPAMSAVCIAYLDPYKARHVSSFFQYAGLGTTQDEDSEGNKLYKRADTYAKVRRKIKYVYKCDGEDYQYTGKIIKTGELNENGIEIITTNTGEYLQAVEMSRLVNGEYVPVYEDIETKEEYVGNVFISEHGTSLRDTVMVEYTDKNGKKATRRSITYNPVLKTKLMGVLTGCLMKAKDPTYSTIYYDYRARLDKSKQYKDTSNSHKNAMAQRYMIKQFLRNLWVTWRQLEGLPVDNPYEVEKLGNEPHKYNEYQVLVHERQMNQNK